MSNKYTNIGEAVVTSTVSGKAKVRVVQKRHLSSAAYWLLAAIMLGAVITWIVRGKAPAAVTVAAVTGEERDTARPAAVAANAQAEQNLQASATEAARRGESQKPVAASQLTPHQQARNGFHKAQQLAQQGKNNEAIEIYRAALLQDAANDTARQAMVDLLLKSKRNADAERALQIGLKNNPRNSAYSMQLARLLAERNDVQLALDVMQRTLPHAATQADYQALYAALLQRQSRYSDAIAHYQKALELKPGSGEWLMGMGISLKALGRPDEAGNAFKHALETHTLSPQSRAFVEQQITPP